MSLTEKLLALVKQHGRSEERQLLSRWAHELNEFMTPFEKGIALGHQKLEIGLENRLTLKLIIKRQVLPPVSGLLQISPTLPSSLAEAAIHACTTGISFHVGLRINPDSMHREIYLYPSPEIRSKLLSSLSPLPDSLHASFYGLDEQQGISAYCSDH
ncbi:MAG: hypothetical protein REI12_07095, partial [Pedobacter sp.]|nr:hypothetical protein [Pedobacter sp.]